MIYDIDNFMDDQQQTHFGYESVTMGEKTRRVTDVFERVASSYDIMNDVMSFGLHRLWKDRFVDLMRPRDNILMLDVAGGTGDIALRFLSKAGKLNAANVHITLCDRNSAMVSEGRNKAINRGIHQELLWSVGDATSLPFVNNTYNIYSIAFGLRNVTEPEKALAEAYRVLKPGGMFYCLEFSKITQSLVKKFYSIYAFSIIPRLGHFIANDRAAYQYLVESIEQFYDADALQTLMIKHGFQQTSYQKLNFGSVAIHIGMK